MVKQIQAAPTAPADILTDPEAAAYLGGVTPRTLRLWRHTRGLPHLKLTSKVIRYRRTDLDAWLNRHRVSITA
jgi:DNA-binding transcriptional MerR regulator